MRVGDPELHHGFRPLSHQTEQYGPKQGSIFINALGGKDESCRKVPLVAGGPRVAVFGDSFAEGWGLPFVETVAGKLRHLLASQGVDVLGFGISSYCPTLVERWMRKLVREGVRWDLAVLLIDPGDSFDEKDLKPFLEGRVVRRQKDIPRFFRLRWFEYSLTYQIIQYLRQIWDSEGPPALDLQQGARGNEWKVAWLNKEVATPWFRDGLEQSARAVRAMQAMATKHKFSLLIVVYPYPKMIDQDLMRNDYTLFWDEFAKGNRLPIVDLSPLFSETGKTAEEVYRENFIPGDFHWNSRGSARVAEFLLPRIESQLAGRVGDYRRLLPQ